jgi:23S rRNA A1618 N6-methylase RlmF
MLALLFRCEFFTLKQLFQSLYFFIKIDQWVNSEIIGELNRVNAVLQDFITDIEQDLRRTELEQSVLLVREKYEAAKVLEVGDKVKKLKKTHEWFLDLASRSPEMREQLKHDILTVKHEIQVAEESQAKLEKWEVGNIRQDHITDPFVGYTTGIISPFSLNA